MKYTLAIVSIMSCLWMQGQIHEQGNFTINLNYEVGMAMSESGSIGDTDIDSEFFEDQDLGSGGIRLDVQYALDESFSLGLMGRLGTLTTKFKGQQADLPNLERAVTDFGLEGRFYPLNSDGAALFIAPNFGFTGNVEQNLDDGVDEDNFRYGGIFYGLGIGGEVMFSETIGANLRAGWTGRSYSNDVETIDEDGVGVVVDVSQTISGLNFGGGLLIRL